MGSGASVSTPHTAPMTACNGAASETDFARSITHVPWLSTFTAALVAAASKPGCAKCRILRDSKRSNIMPVAADKSVPFQLTRGPACQGELSPLVDCKSA